MRTKAFTSATDQLWEIKKKWLLSQIQTKRGRKPSKLDRNRKDRLIEEALNGARPVLERQYKNEFRNMILGQIYRKKRPNLHKKGRMNWRKINDFIKQEIPDLETNNHIYAFMRRKSYIYIGQTKNGKWSGGGKWRSENWRKATSIKIFCTKRKRDLSKFECLAVDIYHPELNKNRPPMSYRRTRCPIHEKMWLLEDELNRSFKLK